MRTLSDQEIFNRLFNKAVPTTTASTTTASTIVTAVSTIVAETQAFTFYQKLVAVILSFVGVACILVIVLVLVCLKQVFQPIKAVIYKFKIVFNNLNIINCVY